MRAVSWIVVLASVLFLVGGNWALRGDRLDGAAAPEQAIGGTMISAASPSWRHIKHLSKDYTEAWNRHDPDALAALLAEDALRVINQENRLEGAAAQREMFAGLMASVPDLTVEMTRLERQGDRVVYHWTLSGTHADSGNAVSIDGTESWLLTEDGLIGDVQETFDTEAWMRQTGAR